MTATRRSRRRLGSAVCFAQVACGGLPVRDVSQSTHSYDFALAKSLIELGAAGKAVVHLEDLAVTDGFPVSQGHTLVFPRRHVASLFDLRDDERAAIWAMVGEIRSELPCVSPPRDSTSDSTTAAPPARRSCAPTSTSYRDSPETFPTRAVGCRGGVRRKRRTGHEVPAVEAPDRHRDQGLVKPCRWAGFVALCPQMNIVHYKWTCV